MKLRINRLVASAVVAASAIGVVATGSVQAAPPAGTTSMAPASGTASVNALGDFTGSLFAINLPASGTTTCGGPGTAGYRAHMYITNAADTAAITWSAGGTPTGPAGSFTRALTDGAGTPAANVSPAPGGVIVGLPQVTLDSFVGGPIAAGSYRVGIMCALAGAIDATGGTQRYWENPITVSAVTPTSFSFAFGGVPPTPAAPVLDGTSPSGGVLTGTFSAVTAVPAVTNYTVTLAPGGASVTVAAAGPYTFSFSGLTNGTAYTASVVANNATGASGAGTATATVNVDGIPAPAVSAPSSASPVTITITPAAAPAGAVLASHTVTIPGIAGSPFTLPAGTNTLSVTGGTAGTAYPFTVQANYNAPFVGDVFTGTFSVLSAQVIIQDIQVVRPQGALVLTQRCGVFGSAAVYTDTTFGTLPALAATADADTLGAIPAGTAPTQGVGGAADTLFPQYPYPVDGAGVATATYPTNCAIDLGTGALITSGPRAGQYFKATGRIAQVTVVNTRDADSGWTLNGRMSDFTSTTDATDTFSGNLLGWNPEVTWDSTANLDGYDMTVTAGNVRQPEASASTTGLGAAFNSTNTVVASSLAQATPGASLGQAVMDARLRLLIPVTADAGIYRGTLTFTTV